MIDRYCAELSQVFFRAWSQVKIENVIPRLTISSPPRLPKNSPRWVGRSIATWRKAMNT
jgi:hypothetical protein